ncbi:Fic family protein [Azospirillum aestuarii]|uniref:Fic family protein n=1 Tax=Azospirillum aestuarii TaxID=2802052 RepID=UPI004054EA14
MYIWQRDDWPSFRWDAARLIQPLAAAARRHGTLSGLLYPLGEHDRLLVQSDAVTEDAIQSSRIEGETLTRDSVRASARRRLGLDAGPGGSNDRRADGAVAMLLDATRDPSRPLTDETLFGWHAALFPTGWSEMRRIPVGQWRTGPEPMQVVSGPAHNPVVHYEAPPADAVPVEMARFLTWFNDPAERAALDPVLRAGLAQLWFLTIHPFEDGNGRIGRAIADRALAQDEAMPQRLLSLSQAIAGDREGYWDRLEETQKGTGDATGWLAWFVDAYDRSARDAEVAIGGVLRRTKMLDQARQAGVTPRQEAVLVRMLDPEWKGFMTSPKWAKLTGCSMPTAQRDIADLLAKGLLAANPGGSKNSSYRLAGLLAPADIAPATLQPFFAEPTEEGLRKAKALVRAMSPDEIRLRLTVSEALAGQWAGDPSRATALPALRTGIELLVGEGAGRQAPRSSARSSARER